MSLLDRDECTRCFGLKGWAGNRARNNPRRKHLACTCDELRNGDLGLTEVEHRGPGSIAA